MNITMTTLAPFAKPLYVMAKPVSSICNLACKYCYYLEKNNLYKDIEPSGKFTMSDELLELFIKQYIESQTMPQVLFTWHGGETLMRPLSFYKRVIELQKRYGAGRTIDNSIQTNGTLLNEDWAQFLKAEGFLVGLSVDGFREAHETHRVDAEGNGTWKRVLAAKALLDQFAVDYNALCVVTGRCARQPEKAYGNLKNLGFRYIQFIACLDPIGHDRGQEPWSLTPERYGRFLCRVFDLWYRDWVQGNYHSIRLFEDYVHVLLGDGASTCATCGKCGSYLVLEGDGSAYPCDFFVLDHWKIGSIGEMTIADMAASEKTAAFLHWGSVKPVECAACPYGVICNGGCKNDWYTDETGSHNYFCASFRELLDHALPRLQQIARAELAAKRQLRL